MKATHQSWKCGVCGGPSDRDKGSSRRYKCPSCLALYCSLQCSKVHKERDCRLLQEANAAEGAFVIDSSPAEPGTSASASVLRSNDWFDLEVPEDQRLPEDILNKLSESQELKDLLRNRHLREYLAYIDTLDFPRGFLKMAMQEPLFVEFADACAAAIHPEDRDSSNLTDEEAVKLILETAQEHDK